VDERLSRLPDEPSAVEVVALLIELPLSGYRRAVDMQIFEFGRRVPFVDRFGHNGTIGEFRLHVQSDWRILRSGVAFVTYDDLYKPTTDAPSAPLDPDLGSKTLRDELLENFLAGFTVEELTVASTRVTAGDVVQLSFRSGSVLEVDPVEPESGLEAWRLLLPDGTHAAVSSSGLRLDRASQG
jgi:hypothetical protein